MRGIETEISAVAAMDSKRGIGRNNRLLFKIKEDFQRLKKIIKGKPIIVGRKTHESILAYTDGQVIPGSTNIVVTHDPNYQDVHREGCVIAHSLEEAIEKAKEEDGREIIIFGGAKIYEQALPVTDRLYLTIVEGDFGADAFFPDYSEFTKVVHKEGHESGGYKYTFLELKR